MLMLNVDSYELRSNVRSDRIKNAAFIEIGGSLSLSDVSNKNKACRITKFYLNFGKVRRISILYLRKFQ